MDENNLRQLCQDWVQWCATRRIFIPGTVLDKNGKISMRGSMLGAMQPGRIGKEPDAIMDARLSYFNMAVHALVDMGDDNAECFVTFYAHQREPVKSTAYRLNISRGTYYRNVKTFAERAQRLAGSFERMRLECKTSDDTD